MSELVNAYLNKECKIITANEMVWWQGTVEAVEGNWIRVKSDGGTTDVLNLEYVVGICEVDDSSEKKSKAKRTL